MPVTIAPGGANLTLYVEVAFGFDFYTNDDIEEGDWVDVSSKLLDETISVAAGSTGESEVATPSSATFTLLSSTPGEFVPDHPQSPHYGQLLPGVPVRITTATATIFLGYVDTWTPEWSAKTPPKTRVSCYGAMHALALTSRDTGSFVRGSMKDKAYLAYWPMEGDNAANSLTAAPSYYHGAGYDLENTQGAPGYGQSAVVPTSGPVVKLGSGEFEAPIPRSDPSSGYTICFMYDGTNLPPIDDEDRVSFEDNGLLTLRTDNPAAPFIGLYFTHVWHSPGSLRLRVTKPYSPIIDDSDIELMGMGWNYGFIILRLQEASGDILWEMESVSVSRTPGVYDETWSASGTFDNVSLGQLNNAHINPLQLSLIGSLGIGHLSVWEGYVYTEEFRDIFSGNYGSLTADRVSSLQEKVAVPVEVTNDGAPYRTDLDYHGPELGGDFKTALDQVAVTEGGVWTDYLTLVPYLLTRRYLETGAEKTIHINCATDGVRPDIDFERDLRNMVSEVQVENALGGVAVEASPLPGMLESRTLQTNYTNEARLSDRAQWELPSSTNLHFTPIRIPLEMSKDGTVLEDVMSLDIGSIIHLSNISSVLQGFPPTYEAQLVLIGIQHEITKSLWRTTLITGPAESITVGIAGATSSINYYTHAEARCDTAGSTLNGNVTAGANTISVTTNSGPRWTTRSTDFPMVVYVGGYRVNVTNITGTGSTQTFTVTPATIPNNIASGSTVRLWSVPRIGM